MDMIEIDLTEEPRRDEPPEPSDPVVTESPLEWIVTLLSTPCVSNREGHA